MQLVAFSLDAGLWFISMVFDGFGSSWESIKYIQQVLGCQGTRPLKCVIIPFKLVGSTVEILRCSPSPAKFHLDPKHSVIPECLLMLKLLKANLAEKTDVGPGASFYRWIVLTWSLFRPNISHDLTLQVEDELCHELTKNLSSRSISGSVDVFKPVIWTKETTEPTVSDRWRIQCLNWTCTGFQIQETKTNQQQFCTWKWMASHTDFLLGWPIFRCYYIGILFLGSGMIPVWKGGEKTPWGHGQL